MGNYKQKGLTRAERLTRIKEKQEKEMALLQALQASKSRKSSILTVIELMRNEKRVEWHRYPYEYWELQAFFNSYKKRTHNVARIWLLDIVEHLHRQSCRTMVASEDYLSAIGEVALMHRGFVRNPLTWKRDHRNVQKQFNSFVRHCFAQYYVPATLNETWFDSDLFAERKWFVHIGAGGNIRTADALPIAMSKKMAHCFIQAPKYLALSEAFRWAQVTSMGGSKIAANVIARSVLGRNRFENENFWSEVVRYLVNQKEYDFNHFNELLDYLAFRNQMDGKFKMKGRSVKVLVEEASAWYKTMKQIKEKEGKTSWKRSGVAEFTHVLRDDSGRRKFHIVELRSANHLLDEGRRMKHCVGTYIDECREKSSTIFSMREQTNGSEKRLATIEVTLPNRKVVQARGKCNEDLEGVSLQVLEQWKEYAGLR